MKILFHNVASKPDGCTIIAVFEVKKEIPDNNLNNATVTASTATSLTFSASTTAETHTATATLTGSNYAYSYYIVANDCPSGATCPSPTPYTSRSSPMQILNWLSTQAASLWPVLK